MQKKSETRSLLGPYCNTNTREGPCQKTDTFICAEVDLSNLLVRESTEIYPKRLCTFSIVYP